MRGNIVEEKKQNYKAPEIHTYSGVELEAALGPAMATYGGMP